MSGKVKTGRSSSPFHKYKVKAVLLLALGLASGLMMVEGFVSHIELGLFVLISLDRLFQSWIQLEVFALMKKYGGHFFSLAFHTHEYGHDNIFHC